MCVCIVWGNAGNAGDAGTRGVHVPYRPPSGPRARPPCAKIVSRVSSQGSTGKVVDRRRTINKEAINFIAEFDIASNGPLARCVGVRPLAIGRLPVVAAAAGGGGLICRRRGRVGPWGSGA